ncbi:MAG: hypothetical protein WHS38_11390 [Thermodesulforhabdaceae bacterium]
MKQSKIVLIWMALFLATIGMGNLVLAGEAYESAFGFKAIFPAKWIVLDKSYAKENPDAVESAFMAAQKDEEVTPENKSVLSSVKEMILRGEIEYYFSETPRFVVAVNRSSGNVPRTDEELKNLCQSFPSQLSASAGKPVNVYECSKRVFNGYETLVLVADGQAKDSRYVQYQLADTPQTVIIFTATGATPENFPTMIKLMESFMNSIQLVKK